MAVELPLTFLQLQQRVLRDLENALTVDWITNNITAAQTAGQISINVNDPTAWIAGSRWEVDEEVFLVSTGGTNPITLTRAYESTIAAAHGRASSADGHLTSGQTALTSATAAFTAADVGFPIRIPGAGVAAADLVTTISAFTSATAVTVATAASTTVTTATLQIGQFARRDPRYLTSTVKEAINVVLVDWLGFYIPQLVWDTSTAGTFVPNRWIYAAPSDAVEIQRVCWQVPGFYKVMDVPHSGLRTYDTAMVSTGYGFEVYDLGLPGATVRVQYGKTWGFLSADTDTVPVGFPAAGTDLLATGAALYLSGWRQVPKFRAGEVLFSRETGQATPSTINNQSLALRAQSWQLRAEQVRARRLVEQPGKVYSGLPL